MIPPMNTQAKMVEVVPADVNSINYQFTILSTTINDNSSLIKKLEERLRGFMREPYPKEGKELKSELPDTEFGQSLYKLNSEIVY